MRLNNEWHSHFFIYIKLLNYLEYFNWVRFGSRNNGKNEPIIRYNLRTSLPTFKCNDLSISFSEFWTTISWLGSLSSSKILWIYLAKFSRPTFVEHERPPSPNSQKSPWTPLGKVRKLPVDNKIWSESGYFKFKLI